MTRIYAKEAIINFKCAHNAVVEIGKIKPNPKNNNKHSIEQIERLAKIIAYNGQRAPITISKRTDLVVKGHARLEAIKKLGWEKAAVDYQDYLTEQEEFADMTADNEIARWAELDKHQLLTDLESLSFEDIDVLGIQDFEFGIEVVEPKCDEDSAPEIPKEAITKKGDLWLLGEHRLLCGDSTMLNDVSRLMGGELADLWITDPPYGVSYIPKKGKEKRPISNDNLKDDNLKEFLKEVFLNAAINTKETSSCYIFAPQGWNKILFLLALRESGWVNKQELIWLKNMMVLGWCDYHYKHEPIIYGWKKNGKHNWYSDRKQTSVLEFDKPHTSKFHPTMKPVGLVEYLIGNNTKINDIILDTFCGSGTSIIACEKSNRKCYGVELSETYCDVIVKRWEEYTGKKAELLSKGITDVQE